MRPLFALLIASLIGFALAAPSIALADPPCGAVEFRFQPASYNLQIVVWVEDGKGEVKATPYITRATGQFGLGNRPGAGLLKTDCGWPYGRREMIFPVWAHRRNHKYPKIVMGGACGNAIESVCANGQGTCGGNCDDSTIAYHGLVSSAEPYFCAPQGCIPGGAPDAVTCASPIRTLSKGAYIDPLMHKTWSLYPPRADITKVDQNIDSPDLTDFAKRNDLVAVSQATPRPGKPLDAPVYWNPQALPQGDYVAYLEVSQEADFNDSHHHPNQDDTIPIWNQQGHDFLGQPSLLFKVPFRYDRTASAQGADGYAGYGAWDGQDGDLRSPDATITIDRPGTGMGRLVKIPGVGDGARFLVLVGGCGPMGDAGVPHCEAPAMPEALETSVNASGTGIAVNFRVPSGGVPASHYEVRYQLGDTAITDGNFEMQLVGPRTGAGQPGDIVTASLPSNLMPDSTYQVAVRGVADCGTASPVSAVTTHTGQMKFTTLSGCFVATAAWGTPLDREVGRLRAFRDQDLLPSAAGQLFVAGYYAFGPSLAEAIAPDPTLRALARRALAPLVALVGRLPAAR